MRSARRYATAEAEDGVGDGTGDGDVSTLADPSNNAKYERTGSTQTELTTIWCDNNADQRPDADAAVLTHVLCFTLTSEDGAVSKEYSLPGDAGKLGLDETTLATQPWYNSISVQRTETNTYTATASGLPTTLTVVETSSIPGSNPGESIPVETRTGYGITWHLKDNFTSENYLCIPSEEEGSSVQYQVL